MKTLLLLAVSAGLVLGQTSNRAAVRTTGQFEQDGYVVYSIYVASGQEDLEQLSISAALPAGTRYLESVQTPLEATYEGVRSDTVSWSVGKLERDTVMGPFVFRIKLDGTVSEVPATIQAAVGYERPVPELVESPAPQGTLIPLANTGSISFDQRGTLNASGANGPVPVGDTGVVLFIPEGAVSERVTLTFTRLSVGANKLPTTDPPTWWCSLYQITSEPQVRFAKSISVALPARRALTPGIETSVFTTNDLDNWQKAAGSPSLKMPAERSIGFGTGGFSQFGGGCISQFGFTSCGFSTGFGFGGFGAFGYVEQDNLKGKVTGSTIGTSAIGALTTPPSINTVLIGARP
ncbi:MAG: hypothetical protein HY820_29040 [Acidobacteria bacterium]|nr:hypothetical protein [Acidobacteriota bacterium]